MDSFPLSVCHSRPANTLYKSYLEGSTGGERGRGGTSSVQVRAGVTQGELSAKTITEKWRE